MTEDAQAWVNVGMGYMAGIIIHYAIVAAIVWLIVRHYCKRGRRDD